MASRSRQKGIIGARTDKEWLLAGLAMIQQIDDLMDRRSPLGRYEELADIRRVIISGLIAIVDRQGDLHG